MKFKEIKLVDHQFYFLKLHYGWTTYEKKLRAEILEVHDQTCPYDIPSCAMQRPDDG
jgi:hypothetical protein